MDKFKTADIMRNYTQVLVKLLVRPPLASPVLLSRSRRRCDPASPPFLLSQRMRQACNHPGLVLKGATDMDALELKPDTPASVSAPSSSGSNDDNLSSMLGSMSLAPAVERAGPSCAICSKPVGKTRADAGESVCSACEGDMRVFAGMQSSTKVRRTLEILDQVRCESAEAARKAAASDSEGDEDEDEVKVGIEGKGKAPRHGPLGPKKTIIFSQVRRRPGCPPCAFGRS